MTFAVKEDEAANSSYVALLSAVGVVLHANDIADLIQQFLTS
jgi:hypothetical protein